MKVYEIKSLGVDGAVYSENLPLFASVLVAKTIIEAMAGDRNQVVVCNPWVDGQNHPDGCMFLQCHNVVEV